MKTYTKDDFIRAAIAKIRGIYTVEKFKKFEEWRNVVNSKFVLEYHVVKSRELPYIILRHVETETTIFLSSVFTLEDGRSQIDIPYRGVKYYFIITRDTLENENILIKPKNESHHIQCPL
jgi:hypothetical protein